MITILDFVRSIDEIQGAVWHPDVREQMLSPIGRLEIVVEDKLTERVLHVDECYVMAGSNQLRLVINTAAARAILEREASAIDQVNEIFNEAAELPEDTAIPDGANDEALASLAAMRSAGRRAGFVL
jgi:hypothetical protein